MMSGCSKIILIRSKIYSLSSEGLVFRFNFTCRYDVDDVLSINNPDFIIFDNVHPVELEIKDTTRNNTCASYLELLMPIDL